MVKTHGLTHISLAVREGPGRRRPRRHRALRVPARPSGGHRCRRAGRRARRRRAPAPRRVRPRLPLRLRARSGRLWNRNLV